MAGTMDRLEGTQGTIWPMLLADFIVVAHALFVAFVVLGLVAILLGIAFRWNWVRNFWFRLIHLSAIGFVVVEAIIGMACPLTVWENRLRQAAGQAGYPGDFIGYWAHRLIFYNAEPWIFTVAYILFGLAVLATFLLAPPRWPNRTSTDQMTNSVD
jgi:hypothetical protein